MKLTQVILTIFCFSQIQLYSQKITKNVKDSLSIVLDEMGRQDQKHRWELMYGTNVRSEIDSINKLPIKEIGKIYREHTTNHQKQIDSLLVIQSIIDAENRLKLISIINAYGFPSPKRINSVTTTYLLLHFANDEGFELLNLIFLKEIKKGNMPGQIYAEWYDRILYDKGERQLYGMYNQKFPCVENIEKTNIERKKIGLKKLKENNCR
jgi:hypothetical protein